MQYKDIPPRQIGIWWPTAKASEILSERVMRYGFRGINRVPVYELPPGLDLHHNYILADGHKRRDAASKTSSLLPCAVYRPGDVIDPKKDGIDEFEMIGGNHFDSVVFLYWAALLHRENAQKDGRLRSEGAWLDFLSAELQRQDN